MMFPVGTLKNSTFFFTSTSFSDRAPPTKLTCSTMYPGCCIVSLGVDLKDVYCSSVTHLALTTYRLVTSDIRLNSMKKITPDLGFVGILNTIPSGLLFHSLFSTIFRVEPLNLLFVLSDGVRGRFISVSLSVFQSVCSAQ
jgi:hypothetical protein